MELRKEQQDSKTARQTKGDTMTFDELHTAIVIVVADTRDVTDNSLSPEECVRTVREDLTENDLLPENMSNDSPELREAYELVRTAEQSDIDVAIQHVH